MGPANVRFEGPQALSSPLPAPAQQFSFPCAACKLRPCLRDSGRRDCIHLGFFHCLDKRGGGYSRVGGLWATCSTGGAMLPGGGGGGKPSPRMDSFLPLYPTSSVKTWDSRNTQTPLCKRLTTRGTHQTCVPPSPPPSLSVYLNKAAIHLCAVCHAPPRGIHSYVQTKAIHAKHKDSVP